ncbi:MAG: type I restriction-modification enzyme R subunit C-terminal domain-containing protein, partial [Thiobacillus sp.]
VTVDMIATGTDIKPVEIVFFMRAVKSRGFFEQMKGRGVRVINPDDLKAVTPDATAKDHFVIIDAVGVCEQDKTDARPMEKKPSVSFERLLQAVAFGNTEDDVITSIAGRLSRMEHRISAEDDARIRSISGGLGLKDLAHQLVQSLDPDLGAIRNLTTVRPEPVEGLPADTVSPVEGQANQARINASKPLCDPALRQLILDIKAKNELTIDHVSQDQVIEAAFSQAARDRAKNLVQSFEKFIVDNKDEITALQILYSKPYKQRLTFEAVKELADAIEKPPYLWNESQLWQAYAALEASKVKGASGRRILTDLVSLVRFAIHQDNELVPFPERVNANFKAWLASQQTAVRPEPVEGEQSKTAVRPELVEGQRPTSRFTPEQMKWLEMIRDHIAANLGIEPDDFEYAPFAQEGGLGKVHQLFGDELNSLIEQLNESLAA